MGKPDGSDSITPLYCGGRTRGTETSKYPEEEKIRMIAQVVASERARAQTGAVEAAPGVVGPATRQSGGLVEASGNWRRSG